MDRIRLELIRGITFDRPRKTPRTGQRIRRKLLQLLIFLDVFLDVLCTSSQFVFYNIIKCDDFEIASRISDKIPIYIYPSAGEMFDLTLSAIVAKEF
jgi:hypothetical protein